ncbi:MAG TPA: ComEC/Rec2 family competence protein [Candidatus Saccharimonas sp.]|nr:ComEC/Rec2 family competence protein [Candidatus Saccharimonas sp.]
MKIITYTNVRRTTRIGTVCLCFLVGIALAGSGWRVTTWLLASLPILAWIACKKRAAFVVPACMCIGLLLGVSRGAVTQNQLDIYGDYVGHTVTIFGIVNDDSHYNGKGQRDMLLTNVTVQGRSPPGAVRITTLSFVQPQRGDKVMVTGKLYSGFGNYQAAIYFGTVTVVATQPDVFSVARRQVVAGLYSVLPDTQASLAVGILLGVKTQLPANLTAQLNTLSLTHIVVASGYNLTVLIRLARRLFEKRSKFQTVAAGTLLMAGFIAVTGLGASMGRAMLVTALSLVAWYYGRHIHPVILLLVSAAITAAVNPLYIWGDLGWWLSFLAFAGVLVVAPLLQAVIWRKRKPKFIGQLIVETVAAEVMTIPILLCSFGNLSAAGLLANLLVVPLVPLVMLLTAIAGMLNFMAPLAATVALPASWLLSYILHTMNALAQLKWAIANFTISWQTMVALYLVIGFCAWCMWRCTRHDFLAANVVE